MASASRKMRARSRHMLPTNSSRLSRECAFRSPVIEKVFSGLGENLPILAGSTLNVRRRQLGGDGLTRVAISGTELTPEPQNVNDEEISVALPANRAGVNSVQIVQKLMLGVPPIEHRGSAQTASGPLLTPKLPHITVRPT